ncbi:aldo/keto reductase [Caldalkalibacillus salinus]|uniref:aldo/keto reductase n=1 Tax=Caldalkalibacillus salinus TaxID=2803787 RepID=UPI0019247C1C
MKKNQLGQSDLYVSEIGLGCMSFERESEAQGISMIHEAIDQGVNFLDTADLYERGYNETLVGQALQGKRQDVILATKVGNRWSENGDGWYWDPSKAHIKSGVKESLRRLQTDYIDLYQLHGGTIDDPIDETIEAFEELKQEGWIRYYGISSIRPNVIKAYVKRSNIVSILTQYSILDRRPEEETLDLMHQNKISAIVRGPVAKGLLTDRWENKLTEKGYLDHSEHELKDVLPQLQRMASSGRTFAQLALRYTLNHPAVATVIPGASRLEQLQEILETAHTSPLTPAEIKAIEDISKQSVYKQHRS